MIRGSLTLLLLVYLFLFLGVIFTVWLLGEWRRKRREKLALRYRLRCTLCGFEFEDRSGVLLPRCPRCGTLNERFGFRTL